MCCCLKQQIKSVADTYLEYTKCALVAHAHQATQSEFQDHGALEGHKVSDVFQ